MKIRNHCGSPSYILPACIRQWNTLHLVTFICIRPPLLSFAHFFNVFSLFCLFFSHSVSQIVVWTPEEKDAERKRVREKDSRRKSGVQCARGVKADKLSCFSDILGVSERPSRKPRWDGRRYRSHGSWMRGTGRSVAPLHIILLLFPQ